MQPQIVADDVKCTHGCTVSDLSEEELFYLRCALGCAVLGYAREARRSRVTLLYQRGPTTPRVGP